jgi:hypothetical protein
MLVGRSSELKWAGSTAGHLTLVSVHCGICLSYGAYRGRAVPEGSWLRVPRSERVSGTPLETFCIEVD